MRPEDVWAPYLVLNDGPPKVELRSSFGEAGSGTRA
jgi:hypothetical protein